MGLTLHGTSVSTSGRRRWSASILSAHTSTLSTSAASAAVRAPCASVSSPYCATNSSMTVPPRDHPVPPICALALGPATSISSQEDLASCNQSRRRSNELNVESILPRGGKPPLGEPLLRFDLLWVVVMREDLLTIAGPQLSRLCCFTPQGDKNAIVDPPVRW
jgi:hypothetical protein